MFANKSAAEINPSNIASPAKLGSYALRYGVSLAFLAIPAAITSALKSYPALSPIISVSFIIAVTAAAWWAGPWAGILASLATPSVLTLAASGGKSFLPPHFDLLGVAIFCFISVLASRVAGTRKRVEQVLRSANAQLESRVLERTADLAGANTAIQYRLAELESLYAELPVGLCFLDVNLRFIRINRNLASVNGASVTDYLGREAREMIPEAMADVVEPLCRRVLATGESILDFEIDDPGADSVQDRKTWMFSCSPVRAESRAVLGLQVIVQDITERKRSERALRQAHAEVEQREEQFRTLANAIPQLCWMADASGRALWYNERWFSYTGTTPEQMQDGGWKSALHPEILPAVVEKWQACLGAGELFEMETQLRDREGGFRWFLTRSVPLLAGGGNAIRWFGTATDVDELRRSHEALVESESRFRAMANSAPVMIWLSGPDTAFTWFNKQWLDFAGQSLSEELANGWLRGIHPDERGRCQEAYQTSFNSRTELVIEYRRKRNDGQWRWVLEHGIPRFGRDDEFLGYIGSSIDMHDRKEVEDNLRRANGDLEQFAFSASHDLQEPIRTIGIYSQMIGMRYSSQLDATAQTSLEYLIAAAKRMEKLVQDLLLYTQIAGAETAASERTDANDALSQALDNLAEAVKGASAQITSDPLPTLRMPGVHLQQLFQNLIGNAIKYRADRRLRIHISAREQNASWIFSVQDNGIGIDPAYKERIFGIFKRLHTADKYSGTGIGLAICQRIVDRCRGRIWVESEPGEGATFFFAVPI